MSNPPRDLTEDQKRDARLIASLMPEIDRYIEGRGIFHFCGGDHYPNLLRDRADQFEEAIPALRRMADFLEPEQETTEVEERPDDDPAPVATCNGRDCGGRPHE